MGGQQIFNTMIEFFEEDEWNFQWVEGMSILSMGYSGQNGKWVCYAQARESQQQFVFYSVLPVNVPEDRRTQVAEYITRANYGMIIGNFEMDFDDGEVRYKTSLDVEGVNLTHPLIRQIVYANLLVTDRYLPGLMRVMYADISAYEALEEVEQLEDLEDYELESDLFGEDGGSDEDYVDFNDVDFNDEDFDDDEDDDDPFHYLDDDYDFDDDDDDDDGNFDGNAPTNNKK